MKGFIEASRGGVRLATSPEAIRVNHRQGVLSVFHGIEGAHALELGYAHDSARGENTS